MQFNFSNNTIAIAGLEPELNIAGPYDKESGSYKGTGREVRSDGSSIETTLDATFYFDWWESYSENPTSFVTGFETMARPSEIMLRRHRDPGGSLICTEVYQASGGRI